jgi:Carboxypeptidase regulatory-like domain
MAPLRSASSRVTRNGWAVLGVLTLLIALPACSKSSTTPTPTTPTTPAATSLAGTVTDVVSAAAVSGATVAVQGKTATTGADGKYSITGLSDGQATVTTQHQGHINFTQTVTLSGATTTNVGLTPSNAAKEAGTWAGTWRNTSFGTTGTIAMVVTVDTVAQTMQIVLDVNGNVFGGADPPAETFNGPYTTTGATLTRPSSVFGNVTVTVTPTGQITGSATNVPVSTISRLDFTGTATATTITINYTVTFVGGGTAVGVATLTK